MALAVMATGIRTGAAALWDATAQLPEAMEALAGENAAANVPQPDLSRVAMIGWSYAGR